VQVGVGFSFTHCSFIADDPRKCGFECDVVWMSGSCESCERSAHSEQARNGHCAGGCVAQDPKKSQRSTEWEVVWMRGQPISNKHMTHFEEYVWSKAQSHIKTMEEPCPCLQSG